MKYQDEAPPILKIGGYISGTINKDKKTKEKTFTERKKQSQKPKKKLIHSALF